MRRREINDKSMDMSHIDETVELGSTEIWKISNNGGEYHDSHAHDVQFEVLSVDGHSPEPQLRVGRTPSSCPLAGPCG